MLGQRIGDTYLPLFQDLQANLAKECENLARLSSQHASDDSRTHMS